MLRLLVFAIVGVFKPRVRLIAENLCLRQQLVGCELVFKRLLVADTDRDSADAIDNRQVERP